MKKKLPLSPPPLSLSLSHSHTHTYTHLLILYSCAHTLSDGTSSFDYHPYVLPIYGSALERLKAADIDQEVKERAITCMGQVVASIGDALTEKLPECIPIFVDRLKNEITRLTTVRAITQIAK